MIPGNCLGNKWFIRSPKQFDPALKSSATENRNFISTGSNRATLHSDDDPLPDSWQGQTGASDQVDELTFGPSSVRGRSGKDASPLDQSSAHAGKLLIGAVLHRTNTLGSCTVGMSRLGVLEQPILHTPATCFAPVRPRAEKLSDTELN